MSQPQPRERKILRPSAQELEKTPLRTTTNGELAKRNSPLQQSMHVRSSSLQTLLSNRVSKETLVASNVLPSGETAGNVHTQAQKLMRQKRRDSLQGLLLQRPTIEALTERNYYKPVNGDHFDENNTSQDTQLASDYNDNEHHLNTEYIGVPHKIEGLTNIVQVACGWSHSLALTNDGRVYSWGSNLNGRLGRKLEPLSPKSINNINPDNNTSSTSSTTSIAEPESIKKSTLFPTPQPKEQEEPIIDHSSLPALIPTLKNCRKIVCGDHHNAALCADGLYVWGRNEFGMLGVGTRDDVHIPTKVDVQPIITALGLPDNATVEDIALGANHTVIIIYGKALAAGWNKNNRLGLVSPRHFLPYSYNNHHHEEYQDTTVISRFQPIKGLSAPMRAVASSLFIRNVAAGDVMTIAVADITSTQQNNYNNVFLWGTSMHSSPYPIIELNGIEIIQVRMGSNFSILLTGNGEVYCFGSNRDFQLGRPASSDLSSFHAPGPIIIDRQHYGPKTGYPNFVHIACGKFHGLGIDTYGQLFGWGLNKHGILGVNSDQPQLSPTPVDVTTILDEHSKPLFETKEAAVAAGFKFVHVDGGASHTLVVDNKGFVYSMGNFRSGKLGL